jgi:type II secretory pathway component PulM
MSAAPGDQLRDRMRDLLERMRSYWENLNQREKLMHMILGGVLASVIVLLPVWFFSSKISNFEEDNARISAALRQIAHSRPQIAQQQAERAARDARYDQGAPGPRWLPEQAEAQQLSFSQVREEPARQVGHFRVHTQRVSFQRVGLRPAVMLLSSLESSRYAVAIEQIHINHRAPSDEYNVEIGVQTFERLGGRGRDAGVPHPGSPMMPVRPGLRRPAGPPPP